MDSLPHSMTPMPDTTTPHASPQARRITGAAAALVAVALVAALVVAGILAFTTRTIDADNIVTFGSVRMQLHETTLDSAGREVVAPLDDALNLATGDASRIVRIRNVGDHPLYVRVALSFTGVTASGLETPADDLVHYTADNGAWIDRDGWRYFERALNPGETTPPLVTTLHVDAEAANARYGRDSLALEIDARGVQSEHNAASPLDAAGWPEGDPS